MADLHLTFELLAAHDAGQITHRELIELATRHLFTLCPTCATEYRAFVAGLEDEGRAAAPASPEASERTTRYSSDEYRRVIEAVARKASGVETAVRKEEDRAAFELRELLRLPFDEALEKVRRARTRFSSVALAEALLGEVRASLPDRPRRALAFARMAETVVWRVSTDGRRLATLRAELTALALAHQGNAHRVLDDLPRAHKAFGLARLVLDKAAVTDPAVLAEIDGLEGSLRRAQRRFGEAERLLQRAVALAVAAEDRLRVAGGLLTLGSLYSQWGQPEKALGLADAAARALPPGAPARLLLATVHNRLFYLCDLQEHELAADLLEEARSLYQQFDDPWTMNRLRWLEGKIARGVGCLENAVEHLSLAREWFAASGALYDAALVSLELAGLHLEAGRPADARQVVSEALPIFAALRISREGVAALAQLRRALEDEGTLSTTLLRTLVRTLRAVRPA